MRLRRTAFFTLILLVGLLAVPVVLTYREVRQEWLNHAMIAAVDRNDTGSVQDLLRAGAAPTLRCYPTTSGLCGS